MYNLYKSRSPSRNWDTNQLSLENELRSIVSYYQEEIAGLVCENFNNTKFLNCKSKQLDDIIDDQLCKSTRNPQIFNRANIVSPTRKSNRTLPDTNSKKFS